MLKKFFLSLFLSLFLLSFSNFSLAKECSLPPEASFINIYYRNILQENYPKYIKMVDRVLENFSKKIENKTLEQKILTYKKINKKIENILAKIENPVTKNVIGYLSEKISYKILDLEIEMCKKIVDGKLDVSFISNLKKEKKGDILTISGDLVFGVDKVVVTYENAGGEFPIDIYKLHNFKPGDRKFKYNASYKYKNLDNGTNYYKITAYIGDKKYSVNTSYKENSIVKKQENNVNKKNGKYCVLDTCLDSSAGEIREENEKFVQEKTSSYILKNKSEILKNSEDGLEMETIFIKDLDKIFVKIQEGGACDSKSIKQEFFDINGKKLSESYLKTYAKNKYELIKIKIGNYYYFPKLNFKEVISINSDEVKELGKISSLNDIINLINKEIKDKKIAKKYIFVYENSGVKFDILYESNFIQPERLVYLGTDNSWLSKNIDSNGNLFDLGVTNKILSYFGENNVKGVTKKDGKRIFKATKASLPIFKVKKFDNNGRYILYSAEGYKIVAFVEMCKPAVYIYNSSEEKNKLFLKTDFGNYFTKLIPEFTNKNSWEFSSKNGKVEVKGKKYNYLYYAIKVKNYSHNKNGWIVSGKNIEKFFNDKLEKINFNKKEKEDFLEYWLPKYEKNKYYFISFKYKKDLEKLVSLEFSKKPNKIFRVLLDSYELEELKKENKKFLYSVVGDKFDKFLIKKFDRNNSDYEVFEWGGVLEKDGEVFVY